MQIANMTNRNTKAEILTAYKNLVGRLNETPKEEGKKAEFSPQPTRERRSPEDILKQMGEIRSEINSGVGAILEKVTTRIEELESVEQDITSAKTELKELYDIKARAGMIVDMITAQAEQRQQFEEEMSSTRRSWEIEKREYDMQLKHDRKAEKMDWEEKWAEEKRKKTSELTEAETRLQKWADELAEQQTELKTLQARVEGIDREIETAVKNAVVAAEKAAKTTYDTEIKFLTQKHTSDLALKDQTIKTQTQQIADLEEEVERLNTALEKAQDRTSELATSFVESKRPGDTTVINQTEGKGK